MEIDKLINKLYTDLSNQMEELNRNMDSGRDSEGFSFCSECGTRILAGSKFCPECGTPVRNEDDSHKVVDGIIMTDTSVLARKYGIAREEAVDSLECFILECRERGVFWMLLDMADYGSELGEYTWMDYSEVLQSFLMQNNVRKGPSLSLFIIGGNDVIPQPAEANPCGDPEDDYQDTVYADFYYCFYGKLPLEYLDFNRARCNVARLPLDIIDLDSSFEDDVVSYLDRCIDVLDRGGINIARAVMTSNADWIPASREMSRNLPIRHIDNEAGYIMDNMYLSPEVLEDMEDVEIQDQYIESISEADMLVFNLHGGCYPEDSGFYSTDLAFSIDTLDNINAPIFNTVACWGGRYIRYTRKNSMLLSAIHNHNVMLYCGSCVPALGKCGHFSADGTWRIQPAAYSESFMTRFCEYQCIGTMKAGEAFLKAKCDYYNTSRNIEDDECTLGTVLMFNLFGNPQLSTMVDAEMLSDIQLEDGSKEVRKPYSPKRRTTLMSKSQSGTYGKGILDDVRNAVDSNLRQISSILAEKLYRQLGLEPRELVKVESYSTATCKGYIFNYKKQMKNMSSTYQIMVDETGMIVDAIQTK